MPTVLTTMECFSKKRTAMIQISICREFQCSILLPPQGRSCPRPPSDGHEWKWPQLWSTRCTTSTAHFPPSESVSHLGDPFTQRSFSRVASVTRFATPGRSPRPRPPMSRRFSEPLHSLWNKRKPSIQWGGPYPNNTRCCTTSQEASYVTSVLGLTGERKDANISSVERLEISCCQDG